MWSDVNDFQLHYGTVVVKLILAFYTKKYQLESTIVTESPQIYIAIQNKYNNLRK